MSDPKKNQVPQQPPAGGAGQRKGGYIPPQRNISWQYRLNTLFTKVEMFGVRAANMMQKGFINMALLFCFLNVYYFVGKYNDYWRLRRDPNIPSQWLEE